jgi:chromosome segregation ATPase
MATSQKNGLSTGGEPKPLSVESVLPAVSSPEVLRRELQEQKRANTLLLAEVEKEREAREALQNQLIQVNAEVLASWERRKEMSRVIGERDAELAALRAREQEFAEALPELMQLRNDVKQANDRRKEMVNIINDRDAKVAKLREDILTANDRRKEMVRMISNRDAKIAKYREDLLAANDRRKEMSRMITGLKAEVKALKIELQARFAELAILQRYVAKFTVAGQAKRIASAARSLGQKVF